MWLLCHPLPWRSSSDVQATVTEVETETVLTEGIEQIPKSGQGGSPLTGKGAAGIRNPGSLGYKVGAHGMA